MKLFALSFIFIFVCCAGCSKEEQPATPQIKEAPAPVANAARIAVHKDDLPGYLERLDKIVGGSLGKEKVAAIRAAASKLERGKSETFEEQVTFKDRSAKLQIKLTGPSDVPLVEFATDDAELLDRLSKLY
jgi:hypothetical protein